MNHRVEKDFIGEEEIPSTALFGLQSLRARHNFPDTTPFHPEWYKAVALVKLAAYQTTELFYEAVTKKYPEKEFPFQRIPKKNLDALMEAASEASRGFYFENFIVPAISGGAGTSINLNLNEIIANAALLKIGKQPGEYNHIDPIEHANIFQSTNDVVPTALRIASMQLFKELEECINDLRKITEEKETESRDTLRIARTQLQDAVPSSYGRLFSTYNDALSRDWWRVSKCQERIKVVNMGGGAAGTGIGIPRYYIMEIVHQLQKLTGLPLTRGENLSDATSSLDSFVEVHAILKALAVNLEKMASDIRLLSSDLMGSKELEIPPRQIGSSIMPGKVNPVIPEFIISVSHRVYTNDMLITSLAGQGQLDLNAYIPLLGHAFLESIKLLIAACKTMATNLMKDLKFNSSVSEKKLMQSPAISTALSPYIGYHKASIIAGLIKEKGIDIHEAVKISGLITEEKANTIFSHENLLKSGFSIHDLD
ncbi:MAG: lyase family protein [Bacteroidales bacterium]|nr:lyase family protein [Bacteroidales bacterium]